MAKPHTVDEERAYIEKLLNTRFNYYLLFVSVLLVPVAGENPLTPFARTLLLGLGAVVSALMVYMVIRTKLLLDVLLTEIVAGQADHPYKRAFESLKGGAFKWNVNNMMVVLVLVIMAFFVAGAIMARASPQALFKEQARPVQCKC